MEPDSVDLSTSLRGEMAGECRGEMAGECRGEICGDCRGEQAGEEEGEEIPGGLTVDDAREGGTFSFCSKRLTMNGLTFCGGGADLGTTSVASTFKSPLSPSTLNVMNKGEEPSCDN